MNKPRIAIITVGELPVPTVKGGGAEILIEQILDENEKSKVFDFVVYSIENEQAKEKSKKYKYAQFVFLKKEKNLILKRLKRKAIYLCTGFHLPLENFSYKKIINDIENRNVDYVLIENTMVPFPEYVKHFGNKVLLHTHWDYINNELPNIILKRYKKAALNCGGIITVSEYIKKRILTVPEIKDDKVSVLKNCTDIEKFDISLNEEERNSIREKYRINEKDIVFIFTGRISKEKGVIELAQAFSDVSSNNNNIKLLIVGSAQTGNNIVNEYTQKVYDILEPLNEKVIFTGYVNHDDMPKIYKSADVALLPSTGQDPAPLTIFEAMASGLPIITTFSGGIPEYANEKCAIINKIDKNVVNALTNSINVLAEDSNIRSVMGKESYKRASQFNTKQYFHDFVDIIDDIEKD